MDMRQTQHNHTLHHFATDAREWELAIAQFAMIIQLQQGRALASWVAERLRNLTHHSRGIVARHGDNLQGMILYEISDNTAELSIPWSITNNATLHSEMLTAAVQDINLKHPTVRYIRAERQLFPDYASTIGMADAGFACYWRQRMLLNMPTYLPECPLPIGYHYAPWNIRDLDAVAQVVFTANQGTLDALLYRPFFGESPMECRHGLLSILAGRYGPLHTRSTSAIFFERLLVGISLVLDDDASKASIVEISIASPHQQRGLGKALLTHSLRILQNMHVESVELAVTKDNLPAIRLYQSLGFAANGDFPVCIYEDI